MPKSIVLSTENLNNYGTWLPVSGARLENFRKNPVMFYDHNTFRMPIGHWENIRIENARIIADPVFDEKDEEAKQVKRKWENGDINGGSLGAEIITLSEDPLLLKQGQRRPTITEYEVYEGSITPLPSNTDCLTLRRGGLQLSSNKSTEAIDLILPEIKPTYKMEKIALKLGLAKEATEQQITDKIDQLLTTETNHLVLKKFMDDQAAELDDEAKEAFDSLKEKDPENAIRVLRLARKQSEQQPGDETEKEKTPKVSEILKETLSRAKAGKQDDTPDTESFDYLQKHDPAKLMNLRRTDPVKFQKLVDDYKAGKRMTAARKD
jgi:hypothetical protein